MNKMSYVYDYKRFGTLDEAMKWINDPDNAKKVVINVYGDNYRTDSCVVIFFEYK